MSAWRVLITSRQLQQKIGRYRELLARHKVEVELPEFEQQLGEAELLEIIDRFDGVIAGDDEFTARVLEKGKRLRVIAKWGVGIDAIDAEAARRLGIQVSNTPNAFADEVADVVMGYVILLARQLHKMNEAVRKGQWLKIQGMSLRGKTLGVIGVGSIGRAVVQRAAAAGMVVLGYDQVPPTASFVQQTGLRLTPLEKLLATVDFLSLNCNLTPANRHLLNHQVFARMKKGVYIINTARGGLIDEVALVAALREGKVAGAAIDVFEREPLPPDSPLRQFDQCIFGTHNSSNTLEAVLRVNELAIQNLLAGLERPRS
jgi:D-3-phosphoglycerate dehydrogenase